ncbi:plasmid replication protein, CyRepA1 family, partial [Crocosphaera sp.]|uniref:plasmid replication protein, CyRepA1 family n=1 Tax=Crocosphaera sp. TaxID=2729996 RepID=UPI0025803B13
MPTVTPLLTHAYLDKKRLTLAELKATASVPIYLKQSALRTEAGFYENSFIFRVLVDVYGSHKGEERILPERVERTKGDKLNDKFVTPGTKVKEGFTPFGFTIDQIPHLKKYLVVMGLADGYRLHQATGLPVFCGVGENNIPALCEAIRAVNKHGKCIVAADNDLAGITAAHKSNCHFIIPKNENDWSDIYQEYGLHALKQQANNVQNPLPLFPDINYPFYQPRQTVKDELGKMINSLGRCKDLASATSLAMSLFEKYEFRMPFEVDCQKFTEALIVACKYNFHVNNLKQIQSLINFRIDKRESKSLALTNFHYKTVNRKHNVIRLNGLPNLKQSDFKGVILFRAWKAIGKTSAIAAPFIEAAQNNGLALAMCHRMSLTAEMCRQLQLTHYKEKSLSMMDVLGLGTCVPSITKEKFQHFIDNVDYVFIDEIAQVLTFLRSKKCSSGQGKSLKTNADVYQKLKQIVKNAKCVLGVDAELNDMVIDFLEGCRPDEAFTIYDINEKYNKETPKNFKKANRYKANRCNVNYVAGKQSLSTGYGDILSKVRADQNLWISLESCDRTTALAKLILDHKPDTKILVINSKTKGNKDVLAFQKNADKESLKYQVIIHSPVISSGISVRHKKRPPHFHHTYFIGGGFAITPSDASQMLARVRYVKNYTVILIPNNTKPQVRDSRSTIIGKEQAAFFEMMEGSNTEADNEIRTAFFKIIENKNANGFKKIITQPNVETDLKSPEDNTFQFSSEFDKFCAKLEENESTAKADFSAGLLWLLKEEGHTIKPLVGEFEDIDRELKEAKEQAKDQFNQHLVAAPDIDSVEYHQLKINSERSWLETCKYLKYYIKDMMNLNNL